MCCFIKHSKKRQQYDNAYHCIKIFFILCFQMHSLALVKHRTKIIWDKLIRKNVFFIVTLVLWSVERGGNMNARNRKVQQPAVHTTLYSTKFGGKKTMEQHRIPNAFWKQNEIWFWSKLQNPRKIMIEEDFLIP